MRLHKHVRLGLSTVTTLLIILVVVGIIGTYSVKYYQSNFRFFKENVATSFVSTMTKNPESLGSLGSLVIENQVYHPSSQQFNFTFTNTGNVAINITKIEIDSPTVNVTSVFSSSTTNAESITNQPVYSKPLYSKILTVTTTSPSLIIPPGQTFTTGIPYNCITDPLTISLTTSRGNVIKSQVAPDVGWYDSNWKFRKKITLDDTKIIGNPTPIQLDNVQNTTGSGTTITLSNFVVGTGANRLLLVAVESNTGRVQNSSTIMTYGGIALTRANQTNKNTADSEIWYLTNPPTGTANIVVPMTSSATNVIVGAYSFYGVDQTFPISFSANKTRTALYSTGNVTVYTTNPNSWVVDSMAVQNNPGSFTQNSAQTVGWNQVTSTVTGGSSRVFPSTQSIAQVTSWTPITQLTRWSWTGNQIYAAVAVEIKPSAFYNFPLLVNETTDTDLKKNAMSNRNDILFTSCDGITKLDHELENYTTTGSLTAWVQVPNIYNTPNNVIYMYYGNNAATIQQNIAATWDPTFSGVWHFANAPPTSLGSPPLIDNVRINATNATSNYQHILKNFAVGQHKDRLLLVALSTDHPYYFKSVTYNGQSLTQIPHLLFNADSEFWYLLNPPVVTADIKAIRCTISTDSACTGGFPQMSIGAYSLYGVDQTTPTAPVAVINSGQSGTPTVTVTSIFPNSLLIDQAAIGQGAAGGSFGHPTWDLASPTQKQPNTNGSGAGTCNTLNPTYLGLCPYVMDFSHDTSASSYVAVTTPCQTITFKWTASVSDQWVDVAAEIKSNSSNGDTTVQDSTSNLNFLSPINLPACGQTFGKLGGGAALNMGAQQNQFFTRNTTLTGFPGVNRPQTASVWYNVTTLSGTFPQDIYSLQNSSGQFGTRAVKMGFQGSSRIDEWKFSPTANLVSTSLPIVNKWHYAVYTYNKTTSSLYIDGIKKTNSTVAFPGSNPNLFYIGGSSSTANPSSMKEFFKGTVDELRYSNTVRSNSWIVTEYNNQNAPSTFYTIGPQEFYNGTRPSQ